MEPSKTKPSTSCTRCGSARTEQRPLFVGMYTHCFACDGPKRATAKIDLSLKEAAKRIGYTAGLPAVRKVCYLPCGSNSVGSVQRFRRCSVFATLKEARAAYPGAGVSELDFDFDTPGWVNDRHTGGRRWDRTGVSAKILSWVAA